MKKLFYLLFLLTLRSELFAHSIQLNGSLLFLSMDHINISTALPTPTIGVVDASDVAVTNGGPAVLGRNTDFAVVCLTRRNEK